MYHVAECNTEDENTDYDWDSDRRWDISVHRPAICRNAFMC